MPIVLIVLPSTFFDSGESICLSVFFLDIECYACGLTRAIQHLIHFDFIIAYEYNKLSIIVFPVFCIVYYQEVRKTYVLLKF